MSLSTQVRTGRWTDESNGHTWQVLSSHFWATWFTTAVAVSLALSGPYVFVVVRSTLLGLYSWLNPRQSRPMTGQVSGETEQLTVEGMMQTATGGRDTVKKFYRAVYEKGTHFTARHKTGMLFVLGVFFSAFIAQVFVGSFISARIATNRVALLESNRCGFYEYDDKRGGEEDAARADIWMSEKERRAAEYAQECYGPEKKGKAMLCNLFLNATIGFKRKDDTCPFDNHTVCAGGFTNGAAVTFDTGLVDSSVLGINYNPTHKFRRTTTCTPLNSKSPYVRHFNNSPEDHGYLYYYGSLYDTTDCSKTGPADPTRLVNYTLRTTGSPFYWMAPVYRVNTYATSLLEPKCDFYQPSPELSAPGLKTPRNKTLTIIFVTALHILYTKPSNDPIFPADRPFRYVGDTQDYYKNSNPKARAFACIDQTLLCAPSGSPCWVATDPLPEVVQNTTAYWFMKYSLKNSNAYDSIKFRLGSALLAQQRVGQSRSRPLPDGHWKEEAEHLFKTSLARAQFDAWSIASGEDHDISTYVDTLPDEAKGKVCGMYKFNSVGYVNIKIWPFIFLICVLPVAALLSQEAQYVEDKASSAYKRFTGWFMRNWSVGKRARNANHAENTEGTERQTQDDVFVIVSSESSRRSSNAGSQPAARCRGGQSATEPLGPKKRDYGSISRTSTDAVATTSTQEAQLDPTEQQSLQALQPSEKIDEEWKPLLIHSIFLYYIPAVLSAIVRTTGVVIRFFCGIRTRRHATTV